MPKTIFLIFLLALTGACSKSPPAAVGIAQFDEVRSLAESFVLRGDADPMRKHIDFAGVPPDAARKVRTMLDDWHGIPGNLKHTETQVMTFTEYEALQRQDKKDLPEDMRTALLSAVRWNVRPEKMVVFTFSSKDPKDTNTRVRWSAGAYQTNGLWFFAASYTP
jgi:hypothetical protein